MSENNSDFLTCVSIVIKLSSPHASCIKSHNWSGDSGASITFSRGSGGKPTVTCFCKTNISANDLAKLSARLPNRPAV